MTNAVDQLSALADENSRQEADAIATKINATISSLKLQIETRQEQLEAVMKSLEHLAGGKKSESLGDRVAEHQRVCEQYTYRDRLLVQEFYFAIIVVGLSANFVRPDHSAPLSLWVAIVTGLLLGALWFHLKHLREDRDLMWNRARELEGQLQMKVMNKIWENGYEKKPQKRRVSGTALMVSGVFLLSLAWLLFGVVGALQHSESVRSALESGFTWFQSVCTADPN